MRYYPMTEAAKNLNTGKRFSYNLIVNLRVREDGKEKYVNKRVKINSDNKMSKNDLTEMAVNMLQKEPGEYDAISVAGITFAVAYDRDLK